MRNGGEAAVLTLLTCKLWEWSLACGEVKVRRGGGARAQSGALEN